MADPPGGDSATTIKDAPLPFMKLPPELRQNVYDYYFESLKDIHSTKHLTHAEKLPDQEEDGTSVLQQNVFRIAILRQYLSLLHTSSLIRCEAAPIIYKDHVLDTKRRLIVRCPAKSRMLDRLRAFCSSIATYNINAKFTIFFAAGLIDDRNHSECVLYSQQCQFYELVERLLKHMVRKLKVDIHVAAHCKVERYADGGGRSSFSIAKSHAEFLRVAPQISGFDIAYTTRTSSQGEHQLASLFVRGPLAKIDWSDLEVQLEMVYGYLERPVSKRPWSVEGEEHPWDIAAREKLAK